MKNVKWRNICPPILLVLFVFSVTKVRLIVGEECESLDIRNKPSQLLKLENCTVIKGSLVMVLIQGNVSEKDYRKYQFPKLREVTEFVLFYEIKGLSTFDFLFPNLTVIRGRRLFLNYALGIYAMPDLRSIGLKNLVEIQRGHVFIDRCPKLCYLDRINWSMLTTTPGVNHVNSDKPKGCIPCIGCNYCWSNFHCQKTRHDNSINLLRHNCHPLCLGGCFNKTVAGCVVCKAISDDGVCVEQCPKNKYLSMDDYRCYDEETCISYNRTMFNGECLFHCPSGYYADEQTNFTCVPCNKTGDCTTICPAGSIQNLEEAEIYHGCSVIDGSLIITIQNIVHEANLKIHLTDIREIRGYLKIYATSAITSLEFLGNLERIQGEELEYDEYGLIIYGNKNLEKLWDWERTKHIDMPNGAIFIHSNYKLCNHEVYKLQEIVNHTWVNDFVLLNDQEVNCDEGRLDVIAEVQSYDTVSVYWKLNNIGREIEIFYRESLKQNITKNTTHEADACSTETWIKDILFPEDYKQNSTFGGYNITNLKQNTEYQFFMKAFRSEEPDNLLYTNQSLIITFKTFPDIPISPIVLTKDKTDHSITLEWRSATDEEQLVTYYVVDIFINPDDQDILDTRNYCDNPLNQIHEEIEIEEDYDDCCDQLEDEKEDIEFISNMDQRFRCSIEFELVCNRIEYQVRSERSTNNNYDNMTTTEQPEAHRSKYYERSVLIPGEENSITIDELKYFTLYTFQFFACNMQGCGAYSLHSDRTAPLSDADNVLLDINVGDNDHEFILVFFQPKNPNGVTLSYTIHYRNDDPGNFMSSSRCITRLEHEKNNFKYLLTATSTTNYHVRVRSISLAGTGPYTAWVNLASIITHQSKIVDFTIIIFSILLISLGLVLVYALCKHYKFRFPRIRRRAEGEEILMEGVESINMDDLDEEVSL